MKKIVYFIVYIYLYRYRYIVYKTPQYITEMRGFRGCFDQVIVLPTKLLNQASFLTYKTSPEKIIKGEQTCVETCKECKN